MHEYSIAYDIYATSRRAALENHATQVKTIYVDFGDLAMVNPEQVEFLFGAIVEDDPLYNGFKLNCRIIKTKTRCSCGYEGSERFVCPGCGHLPEVVAGREIVVTNIEIEANE